MDSTVDSATIGQRLRQLRLRREISQADFARQLAISPAYLNLLEKGRRTMQFPLLLRALALLGADLEQFMAEASGARPEDALAHLLDDPLTATLALDEQDLDRLRSEPRVATTIAALYHLYKNARAQLDVAQSRLEAGAPVPLGYAPGDEVSDFLERHKNYFPELESAAGEVHARGGLPRRYPAEALVAVLAAQFDVTATLVQPRGASSVVRTFDPIA
jgi:transcriptional regulator with XRE-family HTH domain